MMSFENTRISSYLDTLQIYKLIRESNADENYQQN